jgi:glutamate synthase domain-containing protein 2/glutamate synthase domain-containing protein 1/glutamate synthase domain-containing protein 3
MTQPVFPIKQGLYDPEFEHDSCGVGFVVDVKGRRSRRIVEQGIQVLLNLEHRGACGSEKNTGDGAGILLQIPHVFFTRECEGHKFKLPRAGAYGVGMVFFPQDPGRRRECEHLFERIVKEEGQRVLGWRTVPSDDSGIGPTARASRPVIRQIFIARNESSGTGVPPVNHAQDARATTEISDDLDFERKLYVIRKRVSKGARRGIHERGMFYVSSLSSRTIVYKGMLTAGQLMAFYPDLRDSSVESALALVHSRFSTNTFPSWARAHPYRYIAHNGEINTLRGNINWMFARESKFKSRVFGSDLHKMLPVIDPDGSDSAMFDNVLEMLALAGRSLPHAMMMMVPEPFSRHESMSEAKKAFYEYHSCLMEPWDGPALIAFTDGIRIAAVLDRNGLRPSRYYVTKDELVVMASEVGVLDIPPDRILLKGRLQPGRMLLVDTQAGRIVDDEELKNQLATEHPYGQWLKDNLIDLDSIPSPLVAHELDTATLLTRQQAFGYTNEDLSLLLTPMALDKNEAVGSMGTDTPLAVLSERPQLLYNYFKQLFAQVTNPPVDAIREALVMSTDTTVGPEANLLEPTAECARQIKLSSPILTNKELEKLKHLGDAGFSGFRSTTLPMLFSADDGRRGLEDALDGLCRRSSKAISDGYGIILLSDRGVTQDQALIPALLAVSAIHHHLIREGTRTQVGFVIESGEPREVHHFALLLGYGAAAINPYLAFETLSDMIQQGLLTGLDPERAVSNYIQAINKGVVKVISKMGISTIQSYCGAQVFEALGLDQDFVDRYFTWTPSRIGGVGLDVIAEEARLRHKQAFPDRSTNKRTLDSGGQYSYRREGEHHLFNPVTIHKLQHACRVNSYEVFKQYSKLVDDQSQRLYTLRGLMELNSKRKPIPIDAVEPVSEIVKRFKTGAMSYGSISKEAHETLAIAMNRIGGRSNTGEGGEDPARYFVELNGDSRNSAIKQVASGRFGVTSNYLVNAQELQIKIAQGAKPGEGGQLPGYKVYPEIARVRHSTPGVGLISPPPHHDIYSIEDLAELIYDLKCSNRRARISVKLVAEVGIGTVAAGVAKAHADVVLISGYDGGTGASPLTSIKHAGVPWELGLAETHQTLVLNNLRGRITIETDGQLKTGRDVVIAALLGAEEFGFATAPLVSLGCIMMRVCHLNTCPVGVATQDPALRARFGGDPSHVVNFMHFIAQEVRELMAELGFHKIEQMVGHTECIQRRGAIEHWKAHGLDFSQILYRPNVPQTVHRHCQIEQDHGLEQTLDHTTLLDLCKPALEKKVPVSAALSIRNVNRAVGTILGSEVTRRYGANGLPDDTIRLHFNGTAGQSFGAFVPRGIRLSLEGDANDYLGKGLSGGRIVVYPPRSATFIAGENVIIGNVALYGATSGEAYICGMAGERFCVRNSGVLAVVEAVGDHGCEYMTGGCVVVLGTTGRNFAAGMSGGIAYVFDEHGDFWRRCNHEMVQLMQLEDEEEIEAVKDMIFRHAEYTGSVRATEVLLSWDEWLPRFVRVMPNDYRRMLEAQKQMTRAGMTYEEAEMAAFELNSHDLARVAGK